MIEKSVRVHMYSNYHRLPYSHISALKDQEICVSYVLIIT